MERVAKFKGDDDERRGQDRVRPQQRHCQRRTQLGAQPAFSLEIGDASAWKEEGVREAAAAAVEALHEQASTNAFRSLDCPFCLS